MTRKALSSATDRQAGRPASRRRSRMRCLRPRRSAFRLLAPRRVRDGACGGRSGPAGADRQPRPFGGVAPGLGAGPSASRSEGCLRIGDDGPFVIWPFGSLISRAAHGQAQVSMSLGNAVPAGEEFTVARGGVDPPPPHLTPPVPPARARPVLARGIGDEPGGPAGHPGTPSLLATSPDAIPAGRMTDVIGGDVRAQNQARRPTLLRRRRRPS